MVLLEYFLEMIDFQCNALRSRVFNADSDKLSLHKPIDYIDRCLVLHQKKIIKNEVKSIVLLSGSLFNILRVKEFGKFTHVEDYLEVFNSFY